MMLTVTTTDGGKLTIDATQEQALALVREVLNLKANGASAPGKLFAEQSALPNGIDPTR